jgi:hypothetical protein
MNKLNTKNIVELEEAFNSVIQKWKVEVKHGIKDGKVKCQEGIPLFGVYGFFTKDGSKMFVQELADAMNIKVHLTRLEIYPNGDYLCGVFDLDPYEMEELNNQPIPAFARDIEMVDYISGFGKEFSPRSLEEIEMAKESPLDRDALVKNLEELLGSSDKLIAETARNSLQLLQEYDGVLRGLACWLSAGGWNSEGLIAPQTADDKIRWGVNYLVESTKSWTEHQIKEQSKSE